MEEAMKQKFLKLFAYQKKDIELRKLNDEINRDKSRAEMEKNKRVFDDAKQAIADCERQAGGLLDMYGDVQKYIGDNEAVLEELEGAECETEEELEARIKKLESLKSKFQSADKKLHDIDDKSKSVCTKRTDALKSGNAAKQKFKEARDKHNQFVGSKADTLAKLKAELDALRKELDPRFYEEYKKLVADNKFPPFAQAVGDEKKNMFNCGGCGLGLSQNGNALLRDNGWYRCENCRRIIVHFS